MRCNQVRSLSTTGMFIRLKHIHLVAIVRNALLIFPLLFLSLKKIILKRSKKINELLFIFSNKRDFPKLKSRHFDKLGSSKDQWFSCDMNWPSWSCEFWPFAQCGFGCWWRKRRGKLRELRFTCHLMGNWMIRIDRYKFGLGFRTFVKQGLTEIILLVDGVRIENWSWWGHKVVWSLNT